MLWPMNRHGQWRDVEANEADALQAELKRELCPEHALYGFDAAPWRIAWPDKDVAFTLSDGRVALVHLTFNRETSPNWPFFKIFASKAEALPRLALLAKGEAYE
jgi:hypothetical protein